jgi:hypothetical protein
MNARVAAWAAWTLCGLTIVWVCCVLTFAVLYREAFPIQDQALLSLVGVVASAFVGALVASRRPRNPVGWFFAVSAACLAAGEAATRYALYGIVVSPGSLPLAHASAWFQQWLWVPGVVLVSLFLPLYFPNGHLPSRRWRPALWLSLSFSLVLAMLAAFSPGPSGVAGVSNPLGIEALRTVDEKLGSVVTGALFLPLFLTSVASLVVRFWRSRGEERQQMKWVTYAAGATFATLLLVIPLESAAPNWTLTKVIASLAEVMFAGIPVAVGIAVLRYRLYDIDRIINRTLVYGSLTALLALVYFGVVTATQALLRTLPGQEQLPQLVVVASTLVIAALFNPLRRRIQSLVDRRFYRRKYDAAKTLGAFSAKLRDETDLEALRGDLIGVVTETMQPAHVSLWLRPETASKVEQA